MRRSSVTARLALATMAVLAAAGAPALAGELRHETVASPVLGREMPYVVYLPDGYADSDTVFPVLYLLHGAGGDENAWSKMADVRGKADNLIKSGEIPPAVIVMPGCRGCWWVDGAVDKAETAFIDDLMPAIAKRYRTIETREGRLVAGLSAGGYGAVRFAMRYPDRFAAVAALSPAVYSDTPPAHSSARKQPPFLKAGAFDQASWDRQNYPRLMAGYFDQPRRVPMYLVSGDSDNYGIAFETALLFKRLFDRQHPAELRVVDGDHTWKVWAAAIDGAMRYLFRHAAKPQSPDSIAAAPAAQSIGTIVLSKR